MRPSASVPVTISCIAANGPSIVIAAGSTPIDEMRPFAAGSGSIDGSVGQGSGSEAFPAARSIVATGKLPRDVPVAASKNRTMPSPPATATSPVRGWNARA